MSELRNCVLVPPTESLTRRVKLPVVDLPHEWHRDHYLDIRGRRRSACTEPGYRKGESPANKGKKYPATPPTRDEGYAILDQLCSPRDLRDPKHGPIRLRNRTLIATIWGSALRIHEALLLLPDDIDFENNVVVVRRGKGGERGLCGIAREMCDELMGWMLIRAWLGFGLEEPLFPVLEGRTRGGRMSQPYVRTRVHEATRAAGISKRCPPHQWRHAHAILLDRANTPLGLIQKQLRHKSPGTTGIYLSGISNADVSKAVVEAWS